MPYSPTDWDENTPITAVNMDKNETGTDTNEQRITDIENLNLNSRVNSNDSDIANHESRITTNENNIASNDNDISNLDSRITSNDTDIENNEKKVYYDVFDFDIRNLNDYTVADGDFRSYILPTFTIDTTDGNAKDLYLLGSIIDSSDDITFGSFDAKLYTGTGVGFETWDLFNNSDSLHRESLRSNYPLFLRSFSAGSADNISFQIRMENNSGGSSAITSLLAKVRFLIIES